MALKFQWHKEKLIRNVVLGTNYEDSRVQDQKIAVPVRNPVREVPLNCGGLQPYRDRGSADEQNFSYFPLLMLAKTE